MIRDIIYHLFGITGCSWGKCYGGYVCNGEFICKSCGKTIFKRKK